MVIRSLSSTWTFPTFHLRIMRSLRRILFLSGKASSNAPPQPPPPPPLFLSHSYPPYYIRISHPSSSYKRCLISAGLYPHLNTISTKFYSPSESVICQPAIKFTEFRKIVLPQSRRIPLQPLRDNKGEPPRRKRDDKTLPRRATISSCPYQRPHDFIPILFPSTPFFSRV